MRVRSVRHKGLRRLIEDDDAALALISPAGCATGSPATGPEPGAYRFSRQLADHVNIEDEAVTDLNLVDDH